MGFLGQERARDRVSQRLRCSGCWVVQVREGTLDLRGAQKRIRERFPLARVRVRMIEMFLKLLQETRGRIAGPSGVATEDEQITALAARRCGGYAASFFLREARWLRATSPSLSMK